jgi:hypothetical protein
LDAKELIEAYKSQLDKDRTHQEKTRHELKPQNPDRYSYLPKIAKYKAFVPQIDLKRVN